ncbi:hypothetical protein TWF696_008532 [Orbilia brochopaga]|uniref:Uncharacterized protein n=1 Tax=Orbilia brochopaga TaxID=3140254 RepID=A0AAV9UG85_9PEZI
MCYTAYRFVDCNRCLEQERDHTFYVHRHPDKNADDIKCDCPELHEVLDRHLPCPMCLKTILLRMSLEAKIQADAGPNVKVELDYKKYPVFYTDDEESPADGSKLSINPVANRKRERRGTFFGGVENQPGMYNAGGTKTTEANESDRTSDDPHFDGDTLVEGMLKEMN